MSSDNLTYIDRKQAGEKLAEVLARHKFAAPVVVLGLPRGGVPVAASVADALGAPLDIFMVRKIGAPGHSELACGAVASGGGVVWNEKIMRGLGISKEFLADSLEQAKDEILRRERSIRTSETPPHDLHGLSVIIVDDGIATGSTMRAAIRAIKSHKPREVVIALPVGPEDTCMELESEEGCEVVCLRRIGGESFSSVGEWYGDFSQVETEECRELLLANRHSHSVALRT